MTWLLSAFLALGLAPSPVQLPLYRAVDAEPVPVHIALSQRKDGKSLPWSGLTRDDFVVILEKKEFGAESVDENPDKPAHYAIYFDPPAQFRDGKVHDLRLKVRVNGKWKLLPPKWPTLLPKKSTP